MLQVEQGLEEGGGGAGFGFDDVFCRAGGDDAAALGTGFGADFEDVVGFGDDAEVVFDDDHGVTLVGEAVEDADELFDVGALQSGIWNKELQYIFTMCKE
jgi:hypothetical protein